MAIERDQSSRTLRGRAEWLVDQTLRQGIAKARRCLVGFACDVVARWTRGPGCQGPAERPEPGDLVLLVGDGCPPEYRGNAATVAAVEKEHCIAVVLDESRRFAIGNCWPDFHDICIQSRAWRLGERVVVDGMTGNATKGLNGCVGVIERHPREGHPSFVCKASAPDTPQLVVCVRFDEPAVAGKATALLEPRFLMPFKAHVSELARTLSSAAHSAGMESP